MVFPPFSRIWCGALFGRRKKADFQGSWQQYAATDAQTPQMQAAADDEDRRNFRARAEPIRERIEFAQCAQHPDGYALDRELLILEQNKEMALRRRDALRHLQQINGLRQAQFRKAANLEPANAEQNTRRYALL